MITRLLKANDSLHSLADINIVKTFSLIVHVIFPATSFLQVQFGLSVFYRVYIAIKHSDALHCLNIAKGIFGKWAFV